MSEYTINLRSAILGGPTDLSVLMPNPQVGADPGAFYRAGKKYPVLWLLHAGGGDRGDWLRNTNIARYVESRQVIVVMPTALNSDFANHPQFADGYNFSDFFFAELMPFVYNWLPASAQPHDNFIAGYSMGAAGAWMYALQRPELFAAAAPLGSALKDYTFLAPYRELTSAAFRARASADPTAFPSGYGNPQGGIKPKEINMVCKYATVGAFLDSPEHTWDRFREAVSAGRMPKVYLACGAEDNSYPKVLKFQQVANALGAAGITYDFLPCEGGGFGFCDHVLPRMLDFFGIN